MTGWGDETARGWVSTIGALRKEPRPRDALRRVLAVSMARM
jgi:hypothetical protein